MHTARVPGRIVFFARRVLSRVELSEAARELRRAGPRGGLLPAPRKPRNPGIKLGSGVLFCCVFFVVVFFWCVCVFWFCYF